MAATFECAVCHKIFEKSPFHEEALEKLREEYDDASLDDCGAICDDCYAKIEEMRNSPELMAKLFAEILDYEIEKITIIDK